MNRILLVEDINNFRDMLKRHLEKAGFKVVDFPDAESVLKQEDLSFDAGVFDLKLRRLDGIGLIKKLRERGIYFPVIIITAYGDVETAVKAIRSGAYDFIQKPFDPEVLINRLTRMLHEWKGVSEEIGLDSIIGDSSGIRRAKELAGNVAMSDTNVLLIGESGTGKELFARLIHVLSNRRSKPFVVVNSTAIPETLFESELFGIEKGTATGVEGRIGKLEIANGGTVFFDEI
ncbi:MAG TPA: sigma-54-dependent Fis family transcriptional regulator, partial [candidate division WOR-3 bacterium]|nr:sigma-54-dependent Fis family transcriptional regulator [candidate division WOR-3 bacterium]